MQKKKSSGKLFLLLRNRSANPQIAILNPAPMREIKALRWFVRWKGLVFIVVD